jgi:hypothetical protein
MRKARFLLLASLLSLSVPQLRADVAAIRASALPQETAVLAALDDARQLEPYSAVWTADPQWHFPVTKANVAARLGKDLGFLTIAAKNHPDNAELLLLTGLVARYAYNLDVDGSYDAAMNMLDQAEKLAPGDFRAPWFRATLKCQTTEPDKGAVDFLAIEAGHTWDQLPVAFWDDYMECALLTGMPAHALRAISYTEKLHAPETTGRRASIIDIIRKRFDAYDPKKQYEPKEVWSIENIGDNTVFTGSLCGVRLRTHGNWEAENLALSNGSCVANFGTGPYKGTVHDLHPEILVLVQQPKDGESLEEYAKKFQKDGTFDPDPALHCPVAHCIALKGVQPGMYKKDGDGHGRMVFFERDEPEYPGLIFESPLDLPKSDGSSGVTYYRPDKIQERIPGKLYYLVLLDTAASIEEPAIKDFDFFLQNLTVE